jgi:hypothetical protein
MNISQAHTRQEDAFQRILTAALRHRYVHFPRQCPGPNPHLGPQQAPDGRAKDDLEIYLQRPHYPVSWAQWLSSKPPEAAIRAGLLQLALVLERLHHACPAVSLGPRALSADALFRSHEGRISLSCFAGTALHFPGLDIFQSAMDSSMSDPELGGSWLPDELPPPEVAEAALLRADSVRPVGHLSSHCARAQQDIWRLGVLAFRSLFPGAPLLPEPSRAQDKDSKGRVQLRVRVPMHRNAALRDWLIGMLAWAPHDRLTVRQVSCSLQRRLAAQTRACCCMCAP